jgi:hypothetical protein
MAQHHARCPAHAVRVPAKATHTVDLEREITLLMRQKSLAVARKRKGIENESLGIVIAQHGMLDRMQVTGDAQERRSASSNMQVRGTLIHGQAQQGHQCLRPDHRSHVVKPRLTHMRCFGSRRPDGHE